MVLKKGLARGMWLFGGDQDEANGCLEELAKGSWLY